MGNAKSKTGDVALTVVNGAKAKTIRPSRSGRKRAIVLAIVQILLLVHIAHWLIAGTTFTPIEPSESMEFVRSGVINVGTIFFAVALLSTLIFGRWFCGWGCHVVMLQDGCTWLLKRMGIRPKPFRSRLLLYVPFILALYMFVAPAVYRWGLVPVDARLAAAWGADHPVLVAVRTTSTFLGFPLPSPNLGAWKPAMHLTTTSFWATFPGWIIGAITLLSAGFAAVYFLGNKGFCTYGCPYGGFFAPFEQYAPGRIRVTDACEGCGHCTAVCTSNVRVHEEVATYGMVVDPGCMKCLDCVSVCPNDALYFGFGKTAVQKGPAKAKAPRPDLSWPEEIGFAVFFVVAFVATRGLYGAVPMLMAAGVAGIFTFGAWKLYGMVRLPNVNLHRWRLKHGGRLRRSGLIFGGVTLLMILFVAHSFVVSFVRSMASYADGRVLVTRASIFSAAPTLPPEDVRETAATALQRYEFIAPITEGGIGLAAHPGHRVRRAWLHMCLHEFDRAEALLIEQMEEGTPTDSLAADVVRLRRLQVREDEALAYAEAMLRDHPDFVQTLDETVLWLVAEGRADQAITLTEDVLARTPEATELYVMRRLSLLQSDYGDPERGLELFARTIEIDDANPAAYTMYARALARSGRIEDARAALARALELRPDDPAIQQEIADFEAVHGAP